MAEKKRFKRPKIDNFRHYCYECAHWTFISDIGCAHEGVCRAIEDEPTEQDAYDKMCGLFTNKGYKASQTRRVDHTDI